ncbi:hypothetical protein C3L33_14919, partial [Rhododendron williamsianum]
MGNCSSGEKAEGMCFGSSPHKSLHNNGRRTRKKINGTVVLMKKNVLDWTDLGASFVDRVYELLGRGVSLQLISSLRGDQGRVIAFEASDNLANGNRGTLGKPAYLENWNAKISVLDGDDSFNVHSIGMSLWAYRGMVQSILSAALGFTQHIAINMTASSLQIREQELNDLRGTGSGMLKEWDRVYDYAYYNNLGLPDKGREYARPVLGGSQEYPYPRRGRTGRPPTKSEFDTFQDVLNLYEGGIRLPNGINHKEIRACIPGEFLKELARSDGERFLKFPMPDVIKADKSAWRTDEEFAREMVAGVNPVVIRRLQEFPPASKLDPMVIKNKKLFILDHHDALMPYLRRINSTSTKTYATRTILLLQDDGTLKPLAIELSLPHPQGDSQGATSQVFTPQSMALKNWNFTEQALPADLLKRGVAIPDSTQPHGLRLLIEDYPYAVDGLEIWSAIETWVREYCSLYYYTDELIQGDSELQSWWNEVRNVGHGDKKDEPWWPEMKTRTELIQTCTIIIWVASALHAAVNFGQWPYAGYLPNRPTVSRRFMPVPGTPEYAELGSNPDSVFLKTITAQFQTLLGIGLIEILSHHSADEVYLGQRDSSDWTSDVQPLEAFGRFGRKLVEIENSITVKNNDKRWKNRLGPVNVPYTLLYPSTSDSQRAIGLSGMGIPNSVSI